MTKKVLCTLDIAVAETDYGLRILTAQLLWSDQTMDVASALEQLLLQAIDKHSERIDEIVAVPPFVSQDLMHQYDYLKGAYATLLEETLPKQKGLVVVELAEARALAEELSLTGENSLKPRKLPLYLMGEYRNDGIAQQRRIKVNLVCRRGKEAIKSCKRDNLLPEEVGPFLRLSATELVETTGKSRLQLGDPQVEASLLVERAKTFERLGEWSEMLSLIEASLLLQPDQPLLHLDALRSLSSILWGISLDQKLPSQTSEIDNRIEKSIAMLNLYRQGLTHLEQFLRSNDSKDFFQRSIISSFLNTNIRVRNWKTLDPEVHVMLSELINEERSLLLNLIEYKAAKGTLDEETFGDFLQNLYSFQWGHDDLDRPLKEIYAERLRIIRAICSLPWAVNGIVEVTTANFPPEQIVRSAYRRFVEDLASIPNEKAQYVSKMLRLNLLAAPQEKAPQIRKAPPLVDQGIDFKKIEVKYQKDNQLYPLDSGQITGWIPSGKNVDVVWTYSSVYLMKEKGVLTSVTIGDGRIAGAYYDGTYVWIPVIGQSQKVLVLEPESERLWQFTETDGLPTMTSGAAACPVAPGKLCLAGAFDRSWCAMLTFDATGSKSVHIFHEARSPYPTQGSFKDLDEDTLLQTVFGPEPMLFFTGMKPSDGKRILLKYYTGLKSANPPKLNEKQIALYRDRELLMRFGHLVFPRFDCDKIVLIDPDAQKVSLLKDKPFLQEHQSRFHQGADKVYMSYLTFDYDAKKVLLNLGRIDLPDFRLVPVALLPDYSGGQVKLILRDGLIHVVTGKSWWTADEKGGNPRQFKVNISSSFDSRPPDLWESNHYGILLHSQGLPLQFGVYQVSFTKLTGNPDPKQTNN